MLRNGFAALSQLKRAGPFYEPPTAPRDFPLAPLCSRVASLSPLPEQRPMTRPREATPDTLVSYDEDYVRWLDQQLALLRKGQWTALDRGNLAEEIADMGRSERSAVTSNMIVVMLHLLKCVAQPERVSGSWIGSTREHRRRLHETFEDSPSLRHYATERFAYAYGQARKQAADETRLPRSIFPESAPFSVDEMLGEDWLPSGIGDPS